MKHKLKKKFIEELERTPIVQVACEKLGISRNTFYRWCKESIDFKLAIDEALSSGESVVNDVAESNVLRGVQAQDKDYTKYWLAHRHDKFKKSVQYAERTPVRFDAEKRREVLKKWFRQPSDATSSQAAPETPPAKILESSPANPETPLSTEL